MHSPKNRILKIVVCVTLLSQGGIAQQSPNYDSPDHTLRVLVIPDGKKKGYEEYESRVEVRTENGVLRYKRDFSSQDSEHGYILENAQWTRDSQFFVFCLSSSGGHQPWHHGTLVYLRRENTMEVLDDYVGPIAKGDFTISVRGKLKTEVWDSGRVTIDLNKLTSMKKISPSTADLIGQAENKKKPADHLHANIDVNRASAEDIAQLPGIGPALAHRIIVYRQKHGPFRRVEELLVIRGIGPKKWKALQPYLRVQQKETSVGKRTR